MPLIKSCEVAACSVSLGYSLLWQKLASQAQLGITIRVVCQLVKEKLAPRGVHASFYIVANLRDAIFPVHCFGFASASSTIPLSLKQFFTKHHSAPQAPCSTLCQSIRDSWPCAFFAYRHFLVEIEPRLLLGSSLPINCSHHRTRAIERPNAIRRSGRSPLNQNCLTIECLNAARLLTFYGAIQRILNNSYSHTLRRSMGIRGRR
jgi:hypothetical protein